MDPSPVRPARVSAEASEDQQFLLVRFDSDDGDSATLALAPGELGGLIATLTKLNTTVMEALELQDAGPEGPGD